VAAAILLVPAPIKRPYIWDLAPSVSVVRHCLRAGLRVYLIDWSRQSLGARDAGLSQYADESLKRCVARIETESPGAPVFVAGHSLGGTLAAIFAALNPRRISGLILLDAPLHFGPDVAPLDALVASAPRTGVFAASQPRVAGTMLDLAALCAAPSEFALMRGVDFVASLARRDAEEDGKAARQPHGRPQRRERLRAFGDHVKERAAEERAGGQRHQRQKDSIEPVRPQERGQPAEPWRSRSSTTRPERSRPADPSSSPSDERNALPCFSVGAAGNARAGRASLPRKTHAGVAVRAE
jgi:pimeloyl-ACP methyl ester carboxylesterase